jgi:predicted dehydrogenase
MNKLNIGLVGYGFMARAHSNAYLTAGQFFDLKYQPVLKAVAARNLEKVKQFAHKWGYESHYGDWRRLIDDPEINVIDIAAPNDTHAEIAIAAAQAGKMILCEKPLARNVNEAQEMVAAAKKAGVRTMVWYNYRRIPAVTLAKKIVDSGKLGRIYHYRVSFCRIGRYLLKYRKGVPCGDWTSTSPGAGSQEICWLTALIPRSGSTAVSSRFLP